MTFNIHTGVVCVSGDRIRFISRKPIFNKIQFDTIMKSFICYLTDEGFLLTELVAAHMSSHNKVGPDLPDIKNLFSQNAVNWHLEIYDNTAKLVQREEFSA